MDVVKVKKVLILNMDNRHVKVYINIPDKERNRPENKLFLIYVILHNNTVGHYTLISISLNTSLMNKESLT